VRLKRCPPGASLPSAAITIAAGGEQFVLLAAQWHALRRWRAMSALRRFHADVPDERGAVCRRLRRIALPDSPGALWRPWSDELARERPVLLGGSLAASAGALGDPFGERPDTGAQAPAADRRRRFDPPWVQRPCSPRARAGRSVREVLRKQVTQGGVYQVVRDLFYDRERIAELAEIVGAATREQGGVNAAAFGIPSDSAASAPSRSWSSLIAWVTPGACAMRTSCVPTARGDRRARAPEDELRKHTYPVVRLASNPEGRQALPGRFDSCCLPPFSA